MHTLYCSCAVCKSLIKYHRWGRKRTLTTISTVKKYVIISKREEKNPHQRYLSTGRHHWSYENIVVLECSKISLVSLNGRMVRASCMLRTFSHHQQVSRFFTLTCMVCFSGVAKGSLPSSTEGFHLWALFNHSHLELVSAAKAVSMMAFFRCFSSKVSGA